MDLGVVMPSSSQNAGSTQPGDVKLISMPMAQQYATAARSTSLISSVVSCSAALSGPAAAPVVMSPEQVT